MFEANMILILLKRYVSNIYKLLECKPAEIDELIRDGLVM